MNGIEIFANLGLWALLPLAVLYLAICVTATVILDRGLLQQDCALNRGLKLFLTATGSHPGQAEAETELDPAPDLSVLPDAGALPVRLHLGCGVDYKEGYLNVDNSTRVKTDQIVDLSKLPWPWPDNHADEIQMIDVLEHLPTTFDFIHEIHRVLKPGGLFVCHVPYAKSDGAFQDPQHYSFFTEKTFDYVCEAWRSGWYNGPRFERISVKLDVACCTWKNRARNLIPTPVRMFLRHWLWNMFDEVKFVLRKAEG